MRREAVSVLVLAVLGSAAAGADDAGAPTASAAPSAAMAPAAVAVETLPYKLWWSFPLDDLSAIEIDDPDLHVSAFSSRWQFVKAMQRCDTKRGERLRRRRDRDGTPLREVRIEALNADGSVRATRRCVMTLVLSRARLGLRLVERLDDELDAHVSFLLPRRKPPPPPGDDPQP